MSQPLPTEVAAVPDPTPGSLPASPVLPLIAALVALAMAVVAARSREGFGVVAVVEALVAGGAVAAVPRAMGRRVGGGALAFAAVIGLVSMQSRGWVYVAVAAVIGTLAWLVARERPGVSYAVALPAAFALAFGTYRALYYRDLGDDRPLEAVVAVVVSTWVAWAVGRSAGPRRARAEVAARETRQRAIARHVEELGDLQAAWEAAHPGTPMPPLAATTPVAVGRTNPLAVMSLIFGIVGGLAAIPLGHTARSQIARTGERGKGLATAGLVLGYLWLVALAAFAVFLLALTR